MDSSDESEAFIEFFKHAVDARGMNWLLLLGKPSLLPSSCHHGYSWCIWVSRVRFCSGLTKHQRSTANASSLCSSPSSATPSPTHSIWTNSEWNAEQIIRLLVLEQFVAWLPRGTVGWIQWCQHMSLDKAVHLTEDHLVAIPGPSISLSPVPSPPLVPAPGKLRPWNWHLRPGVSPFSVIFQLSRMCYIYWCRTLIPFGRIGTVWLS